MSREQEEFLKGISPAMVEEYRSLIEADQRPAPEPPPMILPEGESLNWGNWLIVAPVAICIWEFVIEPLLG